MAAPAARMAVGRAGRVWRDVDLARVTLADGGDGFKRSWIMLMPQGEFEHPQYGKLEFSRAKLAEFKRNFDGRVRKIDIALDQDHDGGKATGWLEALELRDGGLWGQVRWTKLGEQLLTDQIYRYFSPEFGNFTDPESGKKFSNVIIGGALTNRPFLKSMPAVKLAEVSRRSWASVNKSKLPASCFLIIGDRAKKDTWKLPVYEGAGPLGADGMYTKRGPLNINGVRAAIAAIGGARTGQRMAGVPSGVQAKLKGWIKRYGAEADRAAAQASEGAGEAGMATRKSRKLAEEEEQPAADEQELELDQADEAEDEEDALDDEGDELDEDDGEEDEGAENDAQLAEKSSGKGKPFAGAAKPFGKGGKRQSQPADDAEDEADGGADEDAEEMDDGSVDEEYDDTAGDDEEDADEDEGAEDDAQLAEKSGGKSGKAGKAFPGAAKPFGKGGKRQPADDAEDEADGGADEDAEEMDDMTSDDEEYDDGEPDGDEEEAPAPARKRGEKGKTMKAGASRKMAERMTEPELRSEVTRLREENKTLREDQFKANVTLKLREMTRDIRQASEDDEFALPRAFKLAYREYMFGEGVKLSEESVSGLNELVKLALRVGTVPLTSLASQVERGRVADADDRRPRVSGNDPDMTPEAERVALSDYKRPLSQLSMEERENIYFGLEERRKGKRGSVA